MKFYASFFSAVKMDSGPLLVIVLARDTSETCAKITSMNVLTLDFYMNVKMVLPAWTGRLIIPVNARTVLEVNPCKFQFLLFRVVNRRETNTKGLVL